MHGFRVVRVIVKSSYFQNAQFAVKYCFLIRRNVYSSKKAHRFLRQLNIAQNHDGDGPCAEAIFRNCPQHLRD